MRATSTIVLLSVGLASAQDLAAEVGAALSALDSYLGTSIDSGNIATALSGIDDPYVSMALAGELTDTQSIYGALQAGLSAAAANGITVGSNAIASASDYITEAAGAFSALEASLASANTTANATDFLASIGSLSNVTQTSPDYAIPLNQTSSWGMNATASTNYTSSNTTRSSGGASGNMGNNLLKIEGGALFAAVIAFL